MAMVVGVLQMRILVRDALSLKDKRRVVKSFKDRLAAHWNVSVAEVDHLDSHRRAVLAVAAVGNVGRYIEGALEQIVNAARANRLWTVLNHQIEII